jgi:hypothetical protein
MLRHVAALGLAGKSISRQVVSTHDLPASVVLTVNRSASVIAVVQLTVTTISQC